MIAHDQKRRILYLEANTDGTVGGSHRALFDLVRSLRRDRFTPVVAFYQSNAYVARLRQLDVEVLVLDEMYSREVEIYREAREWRRLKEKLAAIVRRRRLLSEREIDLVHVNNSPAVAFMDWLPAAKLAGIPAVSSAMGPAESVYYDSSIYRWLMSRFDRILPVSRHTADRLVEVGLDPEPLSVVHHGVDIGRLRREVIRGREATRRELGIGEGDLAVTMIANLREWKGQHLLIEAAGRLAEPLRDRVRVVLAGDTRSEDGAYFKHLQSLVTRFGLGDQVQFVGFRDDVADLLVATDVVVHASIRPEPGGIAVLEALALGRPVIAADSGGHTEVVGEDAGVLFKTGSAAALGEALEELLRDPDRRRRLGSRAAERMREFTVERNARATESIYESLWN